jgi:hypothetical protein
MGELLRLRVIGDKKKLAALPRNLSSLVIVIGFLIFGSGEKAENKIKNTIMIMIRQKMKNPVHTHWDGA